MKKNYLISYWLIATSAFLFSTPAVRAQSYDIYVYDVKNATSKKVTTIPGANMYNAAWSNSGKKIAHDVVGGPATPYDQSIFVTDLTTGGSTPLTGAEGGNDAAWSPDGETIVFDAWEDYYHIGWWTQNVYMVPANGGSRSLLRFNAHHASWNPAGNKIAFDDNYGYIGTKDINTGVETFVTWYGDRPTWSPNGQYIAFDGWWWLGGGIWVIRIDTSGYPVGQPLQITTSGYGPTWNNNSQEIVFVDWPNGDPDLYTIPVTGGVATRLYGRSGGFDHGDYDPAYSNNGQFIAWSSFTDELLALITETKNQKPGIASVTVTEKGFDLQQNYPNPFSDQTTISFSIAAPSHIVLGIYNLMGQKIQTLADADYHAGHYTISWNGKDKKGNTVSPGIYIYRMETNKGVQAGKMNLMR